MKLRPYQQEVARAVMHSVQHGSGHVISVEIARQGGKNELSAHIELLLLTLCMADGGTVIKCSPTFKPQTVISMRRLCDRLDDFGFGGIYQTQMGYMVSLGSARVVFLSAEENSNVVGHTADLLMEIDESQDVGKEKYTKEFRPMGSSTNVTTVHYGTTWDESTLLEETKQANLEMEKRDGIRRHFRYDWQAVARQNPAYGEYVRSERDRLGEDHPLFRTQYALLPIAGGGRLLTRAQVSSTLGEHSRMRSPEQGATYVAAVDIGGEARASADGSPAREPDSTAVTIASVETPERNSNGPALPILRIVEQATWTGVPHAQLISQLSAVLRPWKPRCIVVDATGMGQPVAGLLKREFGTHVQPFVFTERSKSDLGYEFLSLINGSRIRLYAQDGSAEYRQTLHQLERARAVYRPNQTMSFHLAETDGHDDLLMSLALLSVAVKDFTPRVARGAERPEPLYQPQPLWTRPRVAVQRPLFPL
ncbi:MAG: hypothetical protein JW846_08260 [Dehalococcoidia bacterium]|nr:hypothetical protein [Dehalococcoidia bacterium]